MKDTSTSCCRETHLGTFMDVHCGCENIEQVKPEFHSHALPPPGKKGRTYICSCLLFLRATEGAKLLMRAWIEELQVQAKAPQAKANDQPGFNWALKKTAGQVCHYLPCVLRLVSALKWSMLVSVLCRRLTTVTPDIGSWLLASTWSSPT